jgi:hypothetical protein
VCHIRQLLDHDQNGLGFYSTQVSEAAHYSFYKNLVASNAQNLNTDSANYTHQMIHAVSRFNIHALRYYGVPQSFFKQPQNAEN